MQRGRPTMPAALAGAVDLSSLKRPAAGVTGPGGTAAPAGPAGTASNGSAGAAPATVIDVTEATFGTDVIERSRQVPVVLDFWAEWCGPCKQFSPLIETVAAEGGGSWVLARIDVDANQRLASAAGVQGIPTIKAVVDGQIVAEFSGAMPEASFRQWIKALLDVVATLRAEGGAAAEAGAGPEPVAPVDPRVIEAEQALQRGDAGAAEAAFQAVLSERPGDPMATSGLALVAAIRRVTAAADPAGAVAAADAAPDDAAAQLLAADVEVLSGEFTPAFERLVGVVRRSAGVARDDARVRLLSLFEVLPPDDPRVLGARRALTAALF